MPKMELVGWGVGGGGHTLKAKIGTRIDEIYKNVHYKSK